ncbi:hypothetical protein ACP275_04G227000 [Erythranthe tilingii]
MKISKILRHVKKLEDEKSADQKLRIKKIVRQMKRLQEETEEREELETIKKSEEEMMKKFLEEAIIEKEKRDKKLREKREKLQKLYPHAFHISQAVWYERDSTDFYSLERIQMVKSYARIAIHVFNQRQWTKYSVVDVIKANSHMDTGRKVILKFTANIDDGDDDARRVETFIACIHYPFNKLRVLSCPLHSYRD